MSHHHQTMIWGGISYVDFDTKLRHKSQFCFQDNWDILNFVPAHYFFFETWALSMQKEKSKSRLSRPISGQKPPNCQRKVWFCVLPSSSAGSKKYQSDPGKISDLKYQTWATNSSYVWQVHVRVRVKVRVNTKKWKISTYWGTSISTYLLQDFLSLRMFR